ncbi:hypothetical protein R6Q59_010068 [Mikania micrantha]
MSFQRSPDQQSPVSASSTQYATDSADPSTTRGYDTMTSNPPPKYAILTRASILSTRLPEAYISPICGAGAGFASGIVTCPLDVIKTKLQAQGGFAKRNAGVMSKNNILYKGMLGTGRVVFKEEGIRGLYRGLGPMLLGYLPTWAVYLSVYEKTRGYFYDVSGSWWVARCYSSLTAGACSTILTNPIWVIKTRLMSQSGRGTTDGMRAPFSYTSTWDAARKMYRSEGIKSFYSGLTPAMLGLTHVAIQFPLYEYFKMKFTGFEMGEHPAEDSGSHWIGISAATFLSKICASTATYPHEVLRTRLQTQQRATSSDGMVRAARYHGLITMTKIILQEEGWRAFYAGIGTNLIRAVPAAMTTMLTYEYLQRTIHHMQDEGRAQLKEREGYSDI